MIDRYLLKQMSAEERVAFEERMRTDVGLKKMVEDQERTMAGLERSWLRSKIKAAGKKYFFRKNLIRWGGGVLAAIIATAIVATLYLSAFEESPFEKDPHYLPEVNEAGEKTWSDADKNLPAQVFTIDTEADTVLESNGGIVLAIPEGCFKTKDGSVYKGPVKLILKEAMDPSDIMLAGLETKADDRLLETGGMFYLNAMGGNEQLTIDPQKGIYLDIPNINPKPGMKLFSGERTPDGGVNWKDPRPFKKRLISVDIMTLDFYPSRFIPAIRDMGKNFKSKKYTDSLYLSLDAYSGNGHPRWYNLMTPFISNEYPKDSIRNSFFLPDTSHARLYFIGLSPSKVMSIWNDKFNNTNLATREFEERLKLMQDICVADEFLVAYIENLDKNLSTVDSMIALALYGEGKAWEGNYYQQKFFEFAGRGDGKVDAHSQELPKLVEYFKRKSRAYAEAEKLVKDKQYENLQKLYAERGKLQGEQVLRSVKAWTENYTKEFEITLKSAYEQLGYKTTTNNLRNPGSSLGATITSAGWYNVDVYVMDAVQNRTSLNYTDPSGKKAVVKYHSYSLSIRDTKNYDRMYAYLLPEQLYSFMRMPGTGPVFSEKLNELINYKSVVVGYKDNQIYSWISERVQPGEQEVTLGPTAKKELDALFAGNSGGMMQKDLLLETMYIEKEMQVLAEEQKLKKQEAFIIELIEKVYRCWYDTRTTISQVGTSTDQVNLPK